MEGENAASLGLTGEETFEITGFDTLAPNALMKVTTINKDGSTMQFSQSQAGQQCRAGLLQAWHIEYDTAKLWIDNREGEILPDAKKTVYVFVQNPDTDSTCAAITYAWLKNQLDSDKVYTGCLGNINLRNFFCLEYFGINMPIKLEA